MSTVALKPFDPVSDLLEKVGNIDDVEVFGNQVLLAIYIRPEKTAGGVYLTSTTLDEDKYQGKIGLVVKKGPLAFVPDAEDPHRFDHMDINLHDWVVFRPSETWQLRLHGAGGDPKGVNCRLIEDFNIRGRVKNPLSVY